MLRSLIAALLLGVGSAISSGQLAYCNVDSAIGKGTSVMKWVAAPMSSSGYRLSSPVGPSYNPGALNTIVLETLERDLQFIGLVLIAESVGTGERVGEWTIAQGEPYRVPASCQFKAVTHANADLKPFISSFFWEAPVGTGSVRFRALIKQGEQAKGNFYIPTDLMLTEGQSNPNTASVFVGAAGSSCDQTCAEQGLACDSYRLGDVVSANNLVTALAGKFACNGPIVSKCGVASRDSTDHCYYMDCVTGQDAPIHSCATRIGDDHGGNLICPCKQGSPKFDVEPPKPRIEASTGATLVAPLPLDVLLSIDRVEVQDETITVTLSGPSDRWFAVGWGGDFMEGTYATVVAAPQNPNIKPRIAFEDIRDLGYQNDPRGWYDAQCQGATNDYCRYVGGNPKYWSCAIAGSGAQNTANGVWLFEDTSPVPCDPVTKLPVEPLPMTVYEYVLGNHALGTDLNGNVTSPVTVTSYQTKEGLFTITFERARTFPDDRYSFAYKQEGDLSVKLLWAIGASQYFDGTPHVRKMDTATPAILQLTPLLPPPKPCVSGASSVFSGPFLSLVLCSLLSVLPSRSTSSLTLMLALLFAHVSPVSAHNWANNPSRATIASVTKPCQGRVNHEPHIQVGPSQDFEMEWSTGHGDTGVTFQYWIALHEDSYDRLHDLTEADLDEYLAEAPNKGVITNNKYHRRHVAPALNNNGTEYERELLAGDPLFIERDPVMVARSLRRYDKDVRQWWYTEEHRTSDLRASYESRKYPWIEAVSKFEINHHFPAEYDLAVFSIPARKGPGNYIMHFMWRGYLDCVDINIQSGSVANRYGVVDDNAASRFIRLDHCEFTYVLNPETPCNVMTTTSAAACLDACQAKGSCKAVQAVRHKNPAGVFEYTPNIPTKYYTKVIDDPPKFPPPEYGPCDSRTIHKRQGCSDVTPNCDASVLAQSAADDDYICYGLAPYRDQDFQAAEDYVISNDPRDNRFYSTCWLKVSAGGFVNLPPATPFKPAWLAGDRCLSCDYLAGLQGRADEDAPRWLDGLTTDCRNCELERGGCSPAHVAVPHGNVGTCGTAIAEGGSCDFACDAGYKLFGAARECKGGLLWNAAQECIPEGSC